MKAAPSDRAHPDREAHDRIYRGRLSPLARYRSRSEYVKAFEAQEIAPFFSGGHPKGLVRGMATRALLQAAGRLGLPPEQIHIVDAGCGQGALSVYLACLGFRVTGVDVAEEGCASSMELASRIDGALMCRFLNADLEDLPLQNESVHFIAGHAALHHFIKYEGVPSEFLRILKPGGAGFFADSFGENRLYALFHNKAEMVRMGDVSLTGDLIRKYFDEFAVTLTPVDWFTMLDKLYVRIFHNRVPRFRRGLSRLHHALDRRIPVRSRIAALLAGSVMTTICKSTPTPQGPLRGHPRD